ncbi:MAG: AMP-binding protein, partial [Rhizobium tropici]|nr:AMP-binding protein [Rhizobium tropici]
WVASIGFDISLFQVLMPLVSGGVVEVVERSGLQEGARLREWISRVDTVDMVPALYREAVGHWAGCGEGVRRVFIGGDRIGEGLLEELRGVFPSAELTVTYGPTEGTIFCTERRYGRRQAGEELRGSVVGQPLGGVSVYIVDGSGGLCPVGVPGELWIGGAGVSRGYLNDAERTAEKYIDNPYGEGRVYRTGDRCRWLGDGQIEFMGRMDEQVKVRGYRIEPGEIARTLEGHVEVSRAEVMVQGAGVLAGYYVRRHRVQVWPSISEYLGYNEIAYFAMHQDRQRAESYKAAIGRLVKGGVVVDVGTGPEAILAQHCVASGARKVYAIEVLPEVARQARERISRLGLSDRIEVICGDVREVELPEAADYCVCALVGNMGSSDGCIPIMNHARRLLKDSRCMIPHRSRV